MRKDLASHVVGNGTVWIVAGVNQAQKMNGGTWWRAELQDAAEQAVKKKNQ